ncbi:hypothetical protein PAXRUDRAFT_826995 [Paxillus rubicundulus Ve08.2h10]|uniref:N-acetyltransferase domain-containing protein n=1 Tax=Paxillus rubicundulus Ve08.2h10 TaxID=930991 RepID=A0A0D0DRC6_9AGAM|nr:hypothetical protein PAXRUDRAFT_826995 [Paxillus rubicundulus Ve08.2h10]
MLLTLKFPRKEEVKDGTHAHISSLSVLPAYRRQGIARQVVSQCRMQTDLCAQLPTTNE